MIKRIIKALFILTTLGFQVSRAELPEESIYQVQTSWINQDNKTKGLDQFKGSSVVISMVYLGCHFSCPLTVTYMKDLESSLSEEQKKTTQFVLVSFDPKNDTPKVMQKYIKKQKLKSPPWNFLTTKSESDVRELAALLDFKFKKMDNGEFDHSFAIIVLDKNGVIKGRREGTNLKPKELLQFID